MLYCKYSYIFFDLTPVLSLCQCSYRQSLKQGFLFKCLIERGLSGGGEWRMMGKGGYDAKAPQLEIGFTLIPGRSLGGKSCTEELFLSSGKWVDHLLLYQLNTGWEFKGGGVGGHNHPSEVVPLGDAPGLGATGSYYQPTFTEAGR